MLYKIHAEHVEDLYQYPEKRRQFGKNENLELTLGSLHSNAMKLIYFLVFNGVMNILKEDYERLAEICQKPYKELTNLDLNDFQNILNRSTFNKAACLRFIGNVLVDQSINTFFTLLVLKNLNLAKVPFEILFPKHDEITDDTKNDSISPEQPSQLQDATRSHALGIIDSHYKPNLKALSYTLSEDKKEIIIYYGHALTPIGLATIQKISAELKVKYQDETAEDLAKTIDNINKTFKKGKKPTSYTFDNAIDPNVINCPNQHNGYVITFVHAGTPEGAPQTNVINLDNDNMLGYRTLISAKRSDLLPDLTSKETKRKFRRNAEAIAATSSATTEQPAASSSQAETRSRAPVKRELTDYPNEPSKPTAPSIDWEQRYAMQAEQRINHLLLFQQRNNAATAIQAEAIPSKAQTLQLQAAELLVDSNDMFATGDHIPTNMTAQGFFSHDPETGLQALKDHIADRHWITHLGGATIPGKVEPVPHIAAQIYTFIENANKDQNDNEVIPDWEVTRYIVVTALKKACLENHFTRSADTQTWLETLQTATKAYQAPQQKILQHDWKTNLGGEAFWDDLGWDDIENKVQMGEKIPHTLAKIRSIIANAQQYQNGTGIISKPNWEATKNLILTFAKHSAENRSFFRTDETQKIIVKIVNQFEATGAKQKLEDIKAQIIAPVDPMNKNVNAVIYSVGFFSKTIQNPENENGQIEISRKEKEILDIIQLAQDEQLQLPWTSALEQVNRLIENSNNLSFLKNF